MSGRYTKGIPEFVYFVGGHDKSEWAMGPFVRPRSGNVNRKFKLVEVENVPRKKTPKKQSFEGLTSMIKGCPPAIPEDK